MKVIILKKNLDILCHDISSKSPKCIHSIDLKKLKLATGTDEFRLLHEWELDNVTVYIHGYTDGMHNQVNKHDMPPPLDNCLCFGDLVLSKVENNKWVDFVEEDYINVYDQLFGGFEDLGSEDTDSNDESDEYDSDDKDFIVKDTNYSDGDESYIDNSDDEDDSGEDESNGNGKDKDSTCDNNHLDTISNRDD